MKAFVVRVVVTMAASQFCVASYAAETNNQSPILIGLIAGTTGAHGSIGVAAVSGAQLAVDKIDAAGGVLGRQARLDANNDDVSRILSGQLFAKLVSAGAFAIAGSLETGPVTAELGIRHNIPTTGVVDDGGLTVYRQFHSGSERE
jgi:branched-chain amino acid transport system substrate-binding protein